MNETTDIYPHQTPTGRLVVALATLDTAMQQQKAAVAKWRASLAALQSTAANMGQSAERLDNSLRAIKDQGV